MAKAKYLDMPGLTYFYKQIKKKFASKAEIGSPLKASLKTDMVDQSKIYVYTGSETDMENGHWYYYNGNIWSDGGIYNAVAVQTDTELIASGVPADAMATGDAILDLNTGLNRVETMIDQIEPGLSDEAKTALLACFEHVAWTDEHGLDYYENLQYALYNDEQDSNLLYQLPLRLNLNGTSDYLDTNLQLMKTKQSFTIVTSFVDDNGVFVNNQSATLYHCLVENDAESKYPGVSLHFVYRNNSYKIIQFSLNGNSSSDARSVYFNTIPNTSLGNVRAVFVYNASNDTMSAYTKINGTVYSDTKAAGTFSSIDNTLLIGAYRTMEDVKGRFFKGTINEFKIYDYAFDENAATAYISTNDEELTRITAIFEQGQLTVYPNTPLNDLKPYLTVTGRYTNGQTSVLSNYTLSGTLNEGNSTVTVSVGTLTTTFTVVVSGEQNLLYKLPSALTLNGTSDYLDTNLQLMKSKQSFTIVTNFVDNNGVFTYNQHATLYHCMIENDAEGKYPGASLHFACYENNAATRIMQFSYNGNSNTDTKSVFFNVPNSNLGNIRAVFVYNASNNTMSAYTKINGTVYSDAKTAGTFSSNDNTLLIGAYRTMSNTIGRFFKGTINEFKIYDYAFDGNAATAYIQGE